jgi:ketosteroid isomerase-like protein
MPVELTGEPVDQRNGAARAFRLGGAVLRLRFEADKLLEAGDQVVALGQMYARGRSTGFEAQIPLALVYTVGRDGKLIRYESFRNTEEALEAVGLRG